MVFRAPRHRAILGVQHVWRGAVLLGQSTQEFEHPVDMFPTGEDSGDDQQYEDLVQLYVEVCNPESVENPEDKEDHDPGIEDQPRYYVSKQ